MTPEAEALKELREYVSKLRTDNNYIIDKLNAPPLHHPHCDDKHGRFDWYSMVDPDTEKVIGYFHTPKGVVL